MTVPAPAVLPVDDRWRRFHWGSPLVRSWASVAVGVGIVTEGLTPGGFGPFGGGGDDDGPASWNGLPVGIPFQLLGILVLAIVSLVVNIVSWFFTGYRLHEGALQLRSGVLSRSFRQAPLDRIQAVDVVQPIVGRLVGLSELRVEVAGGGQSSVRLAYLRQNHAQQIRNSLLAQAAGLDVDDATDDVPEAPEMPIVAVPVSRLIGSIALALWVPLLILVAIFAMAVVALAAGQPPAFLFGVLPVVLGAGGYVFSQFAGSFNFRLAMSEDGVRVRAGLTETRAATIPPGRVQAVSISQGLLWRPFDWWRVRINVAGYGEGGDDTRTVLLPVGRSIDALWVLKLVVPDIGTDDPTPLLHAAMRGEGDGQGFVVSPRRARWLDPLSHRRNGYAVTRTVLLVRSGRLHRVLTVVPHERTQSIGLTQGPVERLARLADVRLHSTPGPVRPTVAHLDPAEALRLVAEQSARSRAARAADRSERWMEKRPPGAGDGPTYPRPL